jgi:hypothetical protein
LKDDLLSEQKKEHEKYIQNVLGKIQEESPEKLSASEINNISSNGDVSYLKKMSFLLENSNEDIINSLKKQLNKEISHKQKKARRLF